MDDSKDSRKTEDILLELADVGILGVVVLGAGDRDSLLRSGGGRLGAFNSSGSLGLLLSRGFGFDRRRGVLHGGSSHVDLIWQAQQSCFEGGASRVVSGNVDAVASAVVLLWMAGDVGAGAIGDSWGE